MDKSTREAVIGNCLQTIHARLSDATSIASAAKACAETGHLQKSIEILFDIDVEFKQQAQELGMHLERIEMLNDHPLMLAALADLILTEVNTNGLMASMATA